MSASHIAFFAFNRPEHTARALRALAANELASESDITIFCDGPRKPEQEESTARVRAIARAVEGFKSVRVIERSENFGLARSIITGVSQVLDEAGAVIVLEDDLITSPYFLRFMKGGLERYHDEERVISICGYTFPVEGELPDSFFLPGAFCWGWGTWKHQWNLYEHDAERVLAEILRRDLVYEFDFQGTDPLTRILQMAVNRDARVDSWALRWMGTACLHRKLTLYPGRSLVHNAGFDGTGRHATTDRRFETPMATRPQRAEAPVELIEDVVARHRALFARWRMTGVSARMYYMLADFLPPRLRKRLYTMIVKKTLPAPRAAAST